MRKENQITLHLQYSSVLDSTVFKTVSRVTDQLRDLYYSDKGYFDTPQTIGDIIPTIKSKKEVIKLEYEVLNDLDVESVINRMNFEIKNTLYSNKHNDSQTLLSEYIVLHAY